MSLQTQQFRFGIRSKSNLQGVKPALQALFNAAITNSPHDFVVICGLRTVEQQRVLVATGKSTTMKSKHLTGRAVDIACFDEAGKITWQAKYYAKVAAHIKRVAAAQGIQVEWGGDWRSFVDMPHFQLKSP